MTDVSYRLVVHFARVDTDNATFKEEFGLIGHEAVALTTSTMLNETVAALTETAGLHVVDVVFSTETVEEVTTPFDTSFKVLENAMAWVREHFGNV